jgi:CheY-like chemotaxis protein
MPGGGHLRIETTNIDLTEIQTQLYGLTEPGPYVRLSLSDTGQGIDAETQAHIFEPFFTTKAPGHGTGLGLSTVHGIITQSGGHIQVVSQPNQGTTFEIDLPRSDGRGIDQAVFQDQAESQYQVAEAKTQPGDYIILVVEDEAIVRDLIGRLLTRAGYNFLSARDGIEALRLSQEQQGSLHLLLTDLTLPGGLNGHQVAHLLMQRHLRLKVLYTSGYPDRSITADELLKPGIAFIQKPFMPQDLLEKLSQLLGIVSENVTSS